MPDGEVGKSGDGHGGFGTWGNFATGVFIYYDDDDVLGVTFGIRYFVLIGFPAITGCFLCHILDPGPLDLGAGLCGEGIKSQRPGTLNPSTVVARERGREREICRVETRGKWHSGCAACFGYAFAFAFLLCCRYAAAGPPCPRVRYLGTRSVRTKAAVTRWVPRRWNRRGGGLPGRRRRVRKRRRLGLGCVCGAFAFRGVHMVGRPRPRAYASSSERLGEMPSLRGMGKLERDTAFKGLRGVELVSCSSDHGK